ncbi:DUF1064 domain-containing protein [Paraburkholderia sp. UCT2]|uniref:DUF1064 domain-containing protein n=1 Tax=Paraburkholderia sp. UCT2 TaxID=2615208 RepID=UPI00223C166B|nr:DUF1064 domain-containing protein [Paraburkholderia sp. UCT2]
MSKNSLRFPESAIAGGRFGTARISGEISSAAARLNSAEPVALDAPIAQLVSGAHSPRNRDLGRLGGGTMNGLEKRYAAHLDMLRHAGDVLWFRFEGLKFRLADRTFYTPDFAVIVASGALELHECKGFMEEDANVKIKSAASQYPFTFRLVRKDKSGGFDIREVG